MAVEWKDTTSYARGGSREPRCWRAQFGGMAVIVLNDHLSHPGRWVMHFEPFYYAKDIGAVSTLTAEQAKELAIEMAFEKIARVLEALGDAANT